VDIEVDGEKTLLERFVIDLESKAPPLSNIDEISIDWIPVQDFTEFTIVHSQDDPNAFIPISPDVSICEDCLYELFDPQDRRYRYPFINCTNCGPRFTIIKEIPYDRLFTTMAGFPLCPECEAEYTDPTNRRFHAQPVACETCGPHVWLEFSGSPEGIYEHNEAIVAARQYLKEGKIIAIKGLGGFHLACDATNSAAVHELRKRKLRVDKPFALMCPNIHAIRQYCDLTQLEEATISRRERPIVVVPQTQNTTISELVAPGQTTLGVMLPYTPLHALLLEPDTGFPDALVMTSGNLSEEPLAYSNQEARERLSSLADMFLLHNRDIYIRCDDTVARVIQDEDQPRVSILRRSRGFAPNPIRLEWKMPPILATGAEIKNTFCLTKDHYAFLSHHIGDMENFETLAAFEHGVEHYQTLFRTSPEYLAFDLHPNYLSTRYAQRLAQEKSLPAFGIQHHHAHIAACMADNHLGKDTTVIGLSFDGTGYGTDGTIWGGEVFLATYQNFKREFHLKTIPLPGGDAAIKEPWRIALTWLYESGIEWTPDLAPARYINTDQQQMLRQQIQSGTNAPLTSSMGRLFDGVAALVGVRQTVNYEAQAAIELEALVDPAERARYEFQITGSVIDPAPMFEQIVADLSHQIPIQQISAKFHNTIAEIALQTCLAIRSKTELNLVALSGGVWQNSVLLQTTIKKLRENSFSVYYHDQVPTNDGGLSLGQAVIAYHTIID